MKGPREIQARPVPARLALSFFALAGAALAFAAEGPRYTVVDLGKSVDPVALNASGDVVGAVRSDGNQSHVFLFSHGQRRDLGFLAGQIGVARGINARGQIVGEYGQGHAFLYANGTLEDLSSSGKNAHESLQSAYGINASGQIVGQVFGPDGYQAVLYSKTRMEPLGSLEGKTGRSEARRINASGQIIGTSSTREDGEHGFIFSQGKMIDLGTLGGKGEGALANDLNDAGQVVGQGRTRDGHIHAFLYANGIMHDLGVPPSGEAVAYDQSEAKGINGAGVIVGWGYHSVADGFLKVTLEGKAFIYANEQWRDLNSQVNLAGTGLTSLFLASAINDAGQIVGQAFAADGPHGFLLTPRRGP